MAERSQTDSMRFEAHRKLATENLKCCPLCGAVNANTNNECFVCRWQGRFEHSPIKIHQAVDELIDRCPELANAVLEGPEPNRSIFYKIRNWIWWKFHRSLDIRI